MRAAVFSAAIVVVGLFLSMAAAFAFSPTWIGLGLLSISLIAAVAMVAADRSTPEIVR